MEMLVAHPIPLTIRRLTVTAGLALSMIAVAATDARAHCDTMDGPVVKAAQRALESGAENHVLIWVRPEDEKEIRNAFRHALAVRKLGAEARTLADRFFFETVVRLHRQGEGEPFTGLKPAGTDLGTVIPATDRALASGSIAELESLLLEGVRHGLHERFGRAVATRNYAADDVAAGRAHVAAYVALTHYAEEVHAVSTGSAHPTASHKSEEAAMSPVQRPVSGSTLTFTLADEMRIVREHVRPGSRLARTLVKNGALRTTLIGLAPGGTLAPHSAEGPITVQVLEGEIEFEADGQRQTLTAGSLIALGAKVVHGARSAKGGMFLLTLAASSGSGESTEALRHPPGME
jgi:quercetin dioxygenase-like cupin family protein